MFEIKIGDRNNYKTLKIQIFYLKIVTYFNRGNNSNILQKIENGRILHSLLL